MLGLCDNFIAGDLCLDTQRSQTGIHNLHYKQQETDFHTILNIFFQKKLNLNNNSSFWRKSVENAFFQVKTIKFHYPGWPLR